MHVDTGHNFDELYQFRDELMEETNGRLVIASVQKSIDEGKVVEEKGINASRNKLQTTTLLDGIEEHKFDCAIGGARRDEEKARAKERFFLIEMILVNGTPRINALNYGTYLMAKNTLVNILEFFLSAIGQKWTFGNIF